ncbi:hypothetical protein [Nonomuraea cavernae]|uniref:hypothetical protein n=1 Tax=Nonomuraea cavernae TaxID=2045107 RepID=UPI0033DE2B77
MAKFRLLIAAVPLVCAAACGAQPSSTGVASAGGGTASASPAKAQGDAVKYAQCMREHGVEMDDPGTDGKIKMKMPAGGEAALKEAQEACKQYAPVMAGKGAAEIPAADQAKFIAYAKCMREHGVKMPDPKFDGGQAAMGVPAEAGVSPESPVMKNADKACKPLLPQPGDQ